MNEIIILMKYPISGTVKTRLGNDIGDKKACEFYKAFLDDIFINLKKSKYSFKVFLTPYEFRESLSIDFNLDIKQIKEQTGQNLETKIANAFANTFQKKRNVSKAIIIGADSPDIPVEFFQETFQLLDNNDVVIGPSKDGGFYLLGINKSVFKSELFKNIEWSGPLVNSQVKSNLREMSYKFEEIQYWSDIDTQNDLLNLLNSSNHRFLQESNTIKKLQKEFYTINDKE